MGDKPNTPSREVLFDALRGVIVPGANRDVASLGFVRGISIEAAAVQVVYQVPEEIANQPLREALTDQTRAVLAGVNGVESVDVEIAVVPTRGANALSGVKNVVAVGAGKGGVGKSTVAALLAFGLKRLGLKAGLLDADVYGPSLPKITGTEHARPYQDQDGRIIPPQRDGVPIMSMGYLVPPDQAVIWRGPMAQKYVKEFLDRGDWGDLDYLIVDLPPGTGDIPLTLAQSIPVTGAVVVCTPQDVALLDAMKALRMYEKLGVECVGVVENMSYYICPQCGRRDHVFGHGGARRAAEEQNVPFLGGIPLNIDLRLLGDEGKPDDCFARPAGYVIEAIEQVVTRLRDVVSQRGKQRRPLPQLKVSG
jgi:ATP-binding protein involved in chromosome partitioning